MEVRLAAGPAYWRSVGVGTDLPIASGCSPRMLYLEAFKNLRSIVLQRNFSPKPREEHAPAGSVRYCFESRRGKRNILGLPRPLYAISSLENLDYIFGIDVTCSAPNSCGANHIPAMVCWSVDICNQTGKVEARRESEGSGSQHVGLEQPL